MDVVARRARGVEQAEAGDHKAIGLAGERRRQQRVTFGVTGKLLRERDEFLRLQRNRPWGSGHDLS